MSDWVEETSSDPIGDRWQRMRGIIVWLRDNGPDDENGDGIDTETCASASSMLDLLERSNAEPPTIWWHGGNAIVLNFGGEGPEKHMLTICGDSFHVHYPRAAKDGS